MSMQDQDKRDAAIRLFEVMSGVDERFLEASEQTKESKIVAFSRFGRKYGKYAAAVLVLAILGSGYVAVQIAGHGGAKTANTAMYIMAPSDAGANMEAAEEAVAPAPQMDAVEGATMHQSINSDFNNGMKPEAEQSAGAMMDYSTMQLTDYLPTVWPEGSNVELTSQEGIYCLATTENFVLQVAYLHEQGVPVYDRADLSYQLIEEEMASGSGKFAVIFPGGEKEVLVSFSGSAEAKAVWEMFASIPY